MKGFQCIRMGFFLDAGCPRVCKGEKSVKHYYRVYFKCIKYTGYSRVYRVY